MAANDVVRRWLCDEAPDAEVVAAVKTLGGALAAVERGRGDLKLLRVVAEVGGLDVTDVEKEDLLSRMVAGLNGPQGDVNNALTVWRSFLERDAKALSDAHHTCLLAAVLETNVQDWDQTGRLLCFKALEKLFTLPHVPAPAGGFGVDFAYAFIKAIDGERDPRCLLATFQLHACVCGHLAPEVYEDPRVVEELFDVVSCYFPIAYTPPKKEANPVKKSELKAAVLDCCTHRAFAEYAVPFALDKMISPIGETKTDSLEFLRRCCSRWGVDSPGLLEPSYSDIWPQLRTETLQATIRGDTPVLNDLFLTVTAVCKCIAALRDEAVIHAHMQHLLDGVLNMASVREGFVNAKAYSALVHFAASSDLAMCTVVVQRLVPLLDGAFKEKVEDYDRRAAIVSIFNALLGALATFPPTDSAALKPSVTMMKTSVLELMRVGSGARTGYEEQVLCAEACSSLVQAFADEEAAEGLVNLALNANPQSLKMVMAALQAATRAGGERPLHAQQRLTVEDGMIPKLIFVKPYDEERAKEALFVVAKEARNVLAVLGACVKGAAREGSPFLRDLLDAVASFAVNTHAPAALRAGDASYTLPTQTFLRSAANLTGADAAGHNGLQLVFALLLSPQQHGEVLAEVPAWSELWCALVCAVPADVTVPLIDGVAVPPERLQGFSSNAGVAVASRLNKGLAPALPEGWAASPCVGVLCRAGAMVPGKAGMEYIQVLAALSKTCGEATTEPSLAEQFEQVFNKDSVALSAALGHKASALWRQKVYNYALKELLLAYEKAANQEARARVFDAVSVLVKHAPPSLVAGDAARLLPLLSEGLASPSSAIMIPSLNVLGTIVEHDPASVGKAPLLRRLIPALLQASTYLLSKKVRCTALGIVNTIATDPAITTAAVMFKGEVVKGLRPALEDHKRCVRAAGAQARSSWYLLA